MKIYKLSALVLLTLLVGCTKPQASEDVLPSEVPTSDIISEVPSSDEVPSSSETPSSETPSGFPATPEGIEVPESVFNYYANVNFALDGNAQKSALYDKIKGHTSVSYSAVRDNMYITDRDWNLSPDRSDTNPYMVLIYGTYNFNTATAYKRSDYTTVWDREHIWAKSHGGFKDNPPAGTDMHHLRASDKNNNGSRGNLDFGRVDSGLKYITDQRGQNAGKTGKQSGFSATVYEPLDIYKGDVARAMFYMATRYSSGSPTLTLVNNTTSSSNGSGKFGILSTLLAWHLADPVDEFEFNRNGLVQDIQKNRNPYIDFPSLAHDVFA